MNTKEQALQRDIFKKISKKEKKLMLVNIISCLICLYFISQSHDDGIVAKWKIIMGLSSVLSKAVDLFTRIRETIFAFDHLNLTFIVDIFF